MSQWYPHYPGDYARDTAHLSMIEHGAYHLLLGHYYSTERALPASKEALHRVCRAFSEAERAAVDSVLTQFFELYHDGYHNPRADRELARRTQLKVSLSERGQRGADKRWKKASTSEPRDGRGHASANDRANGQLMAYPQPQPQPEPDVESASQTPAPSARTLCVELLAFWNAERGPLPKVLELTAKRQEKIRARIRSDPDFPEKFKTAVLKARQTPFLCGNGERGWRASFDWLIFNDTNAVAVLEGRYDDAKGVAVQAHVPGVRDIVPRHRT